MVTYADYGDNPNFLEALPHWQCRVIRWWQGTKGWLCKKCVACAAGGWQVMGYGTSGG